MMEGDFLFLSIFLYLHHILLNIKCKSFSKEKIRDEDNEKYSCNLIKLH